MSGCGKSGEPHFPAPVIRERMGNLFARPGSLSVGTAGRAPGPAISRDTAMKVLVRTPAGVKEVREVDSEWVIPGDVLGDGSVVLELWDELSDDDYLAMGLFD